MKYLITVPGEEPFLTIWFDFENDFQDGMVVYDLFKHTYSTDGINFKEIEFDRL